MDDVCSLFDASVGISVVLEAGFSETGVELGKLCVLSEMREDVCTLWGDDGMFDAECGGGSVELERRSNSPVEVDEGGTTAADEVDIDFVGVAIGTCVSVAGCC